MNNKINYDNLKVYHDNLVKNKAVNIPQDFNAFKSAFDKNGAETMYNAISEAGNITPMPLEQLYVANPTPQAPQQEETSFWDDFFTSAKAGLREAGAHALSAINEAGRYNTGMQKEFGTTIGAKKNFEQAQQSEAQRQADYERVNQENILPLYEKSDAEMQEVLQRRYQNKDFWELAKEGRYADAIGDLALQGVRSVPTSLGLMASSIIPGGSILGSASLMTGVRNKTLEDLKSDPAAANMTDEQKKLYAFGVGALESSTEVIGNIPLMSAVKKQFGKAVADEVLTEAVKRTTAQTMRNYGKAALLEPSVEFIEEFANSVGQQTLGILLERDEEFKLSEALKQGVYGMAGGMYTTPIGVGAQYRQHSKEDKFIADYEAQMQDISRNGTITTASDVDGKEYIILDETATTYTVLDNEGKKAISKGEVDNVESINVRDRAKSLYEAQQAIQEKPILDNAIVEYQGAKHSVVSPKPDENGDILIDIDGQITPVKPNEVTVVDEQPAPITEEGAVDYNSIDDATTYAQQVNKEFGAEASNVVQAELQKANDELQKIYENKTIDNMESLQAVEGKIAMLTEAQSMLPTINEPQVAPQETEPEQAEQAIQYPTKKDGSPDFKAFTPSNTFEYTKAQDGEQVAIQDAKDEVSAINSKISDVDTKIKKASANDRLQLREQKRQLQAQLEEWQAFVPVTPIENPNAVIQTPEEKQAIETQQQIERESIQGTPDVTTDNAQAARNRGFRSVNNTRVDRNEPIQVDSFTEAERKFDAQNSIPVKRTIVEATQLEPSHRAGVRNNKFFITEAQPKERTDDASNLASTQIAQNMNAPEITLGVTAYSGAPIVNSRGEVIQGNNRTIALQKMYDSGMSAEYKEYLKANAADYGMTAEQVEAMQNPVAVDIADVTDQQAIQLGQLNAANTESGGVERIPAAQTINLLEGNTERIATILFPDNNDFTLAESINENGSEVIKYLRSKDAITDTQAQSAYDSKGNLTPEAKTDIQNLLTEALFIGANDNIKLMFSKLPDKAKKALLQTIHRDAQSPIESRIITDVQQAIEAYYFLQQDEQFIAAKNEKDIRDVVKSNKAQTSMFDSETNQPLSKYSDFAIELAIMFKANTQNYQRGLLNSFFDNVQGVGGDLFTPAEQLELTEAINKYFSNESNNSAIVGDSSAPSGTEQQGSDNQAGSGEQQTPSGEPTDSAGGTANDSEVEPIQYSIVKPNDETLVGLHNITEEKLQSAMKMGGLANPSMAVIDTEKGGHSSFGEITFIAPPSLIEKSSGKNVGTWTADAYTPRYPQISYEASRGARKEIQDLTKSINEISLRNHIESQVVYAADNSLANFARENTVKALYLAEKGKLDLIYYPLRSKIGLQDSDKDLANIDYYEYTNKLTPEQKERVNTLYENYVKRINDIDIKRLKHKGTSESDIKAYEDMLNELYYNADGTIKTDDVGFTDFLNTIAKELRNMGKLDEYSTINNNIHSNELDDVDSPNYSEYMQWATDLYNSLGVKEKIFLGYTPSGNRRYSAHTLENVSKIMKKKGRAGGENFGGIGSIRAKITPLLKTIKQIKANKDRIVTHDEFEQIKEEISYKYFAAASLFSEHRSGRVVEENMEELLLSRNPKQYAKQEFGKELTDEQVQNLLELKEALYNMPTEYFETKFERPVYVYEFAGAVVPSNVDQSIKDYLNKEGVPFVEYDGDNRVEVTNGFIQELNKSNPILFQVDQQPTTLTESEELAYDATRIMLDNAGIEVEVVEGAPSEDVQMQTESPIVTEAKSNGTYLKAPNGADTNLTPQQWEQVRTPEFKEWFGDWENDPQNASKVVDENGEPMVVYHSSPNVFTEFDSKYMGGTGTSQGQGFYFTPDEQFSRGYGSNTMGVFLNIRNYLDSNKRNITKPQLKKVIDKLDKHLIKEDEDGIDYLSNYGDVEYEGRNNVLRDAVEQEHEYSDNDVDLIGGMINASGNFSAVQYVLKETLGYDGIISENGNEIVALHPTDIKSATSNIGTFDANNPDIRYLQTPQGVVYGYTTGGKIYLTKAGLNPNSPIHEYTHIWDKAAQKNNPELWNRGVELMKQTSLWEQVKNDPNYANIANDDNLVASEVHARLTGEQGAEILTQMSKEALNEVGVVNKAKALDVVNKLKAWVNEFWTWVKDTMTPWTKEEAEAITLEEFINMPIGDLAKGTKLDATDSNTEYMFAGEKGATALDKAEEATTRLDNLNVAKEMEAANKDANTIKLATGWEKGADNLWRYEVEDMNLHFMNNNETFGNYMWKREKNFVAKGGNPDALMTLERMLDSLTEFEKLFSAYPSLKNIEVVASSESGGSYNADKNRISIYNGMNKQQAESTLNHEIQHAIQEIEGFARGTNPEIIQERLIEEAQQYQGDDAEYAIDAAEFEAQDQYHRTAGEVEARNVQSRMGMTPEERLNSLAEQTEDVAREDQIFIKDGIAGAYAFANSARTTDDYKKGKSTFQKMPLTIELEKGDERKGTDKAGNDWSVTLNNPYGYIKRTKGKDGEEIDVFLGDNSESPNVYVIDQVKEDGTFDEHKVMLGFDNEQDAAAAYLSNYEQGWTGLGNITEVKISEFKKWKDRPTAKRIPFAEYKSVAFNDALFAKKIETKRLDKKAINTFFDNMHILKEYQDYLYEKGVDVPFNFRPYDNATLIAGRDMQESILFQENQLKNLGEKLAVLSAKGIELSDIDNYLAYDDNADFTQEERVLKTIDIYMIAKHASERNAYIFDKNGKENGSGMTDEQANAIVAEFESNFEEAEINEFWDAVKQTTDFALVTQFQGDLISQTKLNELRDMFTYYVPLRGWDEMYSDGTDYSILGFGSVSSTKTNLKKKASGRTTIAASPLATMANMGYTAIFEKNRNRFRRTVFNMVTRNPDRTELFTKKRMYYKYIGTDADGNAQYVEVMEEPTKEQLDSGEYFKTADGIDVVGKSTTEQSKHNVDVYVNGTKYTIQFKYNKGILAAQAINNVDKNDAHKFFKFLAKGTRFMSANSTMRNPEFFTTNTVRDASFAMLSLGVQGKKAMALLPYMFKAYGAIHRNITKQEAKTPEAQQMTDAYNEFLLQGGSTGYSITKDFDEIVNDLQKEIGYALGKKKKIGLVNNLMVKGLMFGLQYVGTMAENSIRFAAYMEAIDRGAKPAEAALEGKEITVNFNRRGTIGQELNSWSSFANAILQGTYKGAVLSKRYPKAMATALGSLMAVGFGTAMLSALLGGEDENGEPNYYNISEFTRNNNMLIPIGDGKFIKIPMPPFFRVAYGTGAMSYDVIAGRKDGLNLAGDVGLNAVNELSPFNFRVEDIDKGFGNSLVSLSPTVAKPFFEAYLSNQDFLGRDITRTPYDDKMILQLPQYQQANSLTNEYLIQLSANLNALMGGDENISARLKQQDDGGVERSYFGGLSDINPSSVEHVLKSYLGGLYGLGDNVVKTIGAVTDEDRELDSRTIPFVRRFYEDTSGRSSSWRIYLTEQEKIRDFVYYEKARLQLAKQYVGTEQSAKRTQDYMATMMTAEMEWAATFMARHEAIQAVSNLMFMTPPGMGEDKDVRSMGDVDAMKSEIGKSLVLSQKTLKKIRDIMVSDLAKEIINHNE